MTRPRSSAGPLAAALGARGARVVFAPLIRTLPPRSWRGLDAALKGLERFDAVAFASASAVESVFARAKSLRIRLKKPRVVAAVGKATAGALSARGWKPAVVPEDARAAGLARALKLPRGARVLLPRAERGLEILPKSLAASGAVVARAAAYRTVADASGRRALKRALASGADAAFFASGSAAAAAKGLRRAFRGCAVVAIGPTTAAALSAAGLRPAAVAKTPEVGAQLAAIEAAVRRRP